MVYISKSEKDTIELAHKIASKSKGGDIFGLSGELGAGKTTFVKGFCDFFEVIETVTSPTYVIMKNYLCSKRINNVREIIHVDSYRIDEIESIGLSDYYQQDDVIILIEWPEKIKKFLPARAKLLEFKYTGKNSRTITEISKDDPCN